MCPHECVLPLVPNFATKNLKTGLQPCNSLKVGHSSADARTMQGKTQSRINIRGSYAVVDVFAEFDAMRANLVISKTYEGIEPETVGMHLSADELRQLASSLERVADCMDVGKV